MYKGNMHRVFLLGRGLKEGGGFRVGRGQGGGESVPVTALGKESV